MKDIFMLAVIVVVILGMLGIGAWLIIEGHPWFGFLVIIMAGGARYHSES